MGSSNTKESTKESTTQAAKRVINNHRDYIENEIGDLYFEDIEILAKCEGFKDESYNCKRGQPTIGFGQNLNVGYNKKIFEKILKKYNKTLADLQSGEYTISEKDAVEGFWEAVKVNLEECRRLFPGFDKLSGTSRGIVLNVMYQQGRKGVENMKGFCKVVEQAIQGEGSHKDILAALEKTEFAKKHSHRMDHMRAVLEFEEEEYEIFGIKVRVRIKVIYVTVYR